MRTIIAALGASSLLLASAAVAQNANAGGNGGKSLGNGQGRAGEQNKGRAVGRDRDSGPAKAKRNEHGKAFGKGPRVCLITFDDAEGVEAEDVVKAQYLPLGVALNRKNRVSGDVQSINTYGPDAATGAGIDRARLDPKEVVSEFAAAEGDSTRDVCAFLAELADEKDGEDSDGAGEQDS